MYIKTMGQPPGCKLIRLNADINEGIICSFSVRGDFFASPEEGFEAAERRMVGIALKDAAVSFNTFLEEEGVDCSGINGEAVALLLKTAFDAAMEKHD